MTKINIQSVINILETLSTTYPLSSLKVDELSKLAINAINISERANKIIKERLDKNKDYKVPEGMKKELADEMAKGKEVYVQNIKNILKSIAVNPAAMNEGNEDDIDIDIKLVTEDIVLLILKNTLVTKDGMLMLVYSPMAADILLNSNKVTLARVLVDNFEPAVISFYLETIVNTLGKDIIPQTLALTTIMDDINEKKKEGTKAEEILDKDIESRKEAINKLIAKTIKPCTCGAKDCNATSIDTEVLTDDEVIEIFKKAVIHNGEGVTNVLFNNVASAVITARNPEFFVNNIDYVTMDLMVKLYASIAEHTTNMDIMNNITKTMLRLNSSK